MTEEWHRGDYTISTDPARLDIAVIHQYLSTASYWAVLPPGNARLPKHARKSRRHRRQQEGCGGD